MLLDRPRIKRQAFIRSDDSRVSSQYDRCLLPATPYQAVVGFDGEKVIVMSYSRSH